MGNGGADGSSHSAGWRMASTAMRLVIIASRADGEEPRIRMYEGEAPTASVEGSTSAAHDDRGGRRGAAHD